MGLRNANQSNLFGPSARALRRGSDSLLQPPQIFSYEIVRHGQNRIVARAALRHPTSAVRLAYKVITTPGKLIAIEGIDGSGKRTQLELLERALAARSLHTHSTGFPQYDSHFGKMVGQFLNGDFGDVESLDPRLTSTLYAGDRFEAKPALTTALEQGKIVLVDRYIASNLAHQTARVPLGDRDQFINWVEHLEYNIYGLPREDLVLYLRVPPLEAHALVARKSARTYTTAKRDILEASLRHLEEAAQLYDSLARRPHWATVQCFDNVKHAMRPPDKIAQDVFSAVESLLANRITPQSARSIR